MTTERPTANTQYPKKDYFGISVIICCHNSAQLISRTLHHIFNQRLPRSFRLEVILVDNVSTDDTATVAQKEWQKDFELKEQFDFEIIEEPRLGLAYARLAGVRNASYDYLIFCDDDNFLDNNYCYQAYALMEEDPGIGAAGGHGEPLFETRDIPDWVNTIGLSYGWGAQWHQEGYIQTYTLYGAGMVVRKAIIDKLLNVDYQPMMVGRQGEELTCGDDEEITIWCRIMGFQLFYSPQLKFGHHIKEERLTSEYVEALYRGYGKSLANQIPLQIVLNNQENTFKASWNYQMIKWTLIALFHCLKWDNNAVLRKLDCICNRKRVLTLAETRRTFNDKLQYLIGVKKEILNTFERRPIYTYN